MDRFEFWKDVDKSKVLAAEEWSAGKKWSVETKEVWKRRKVAATKED